MNTETYQEERDGHEAGDELISPDLSSLQVDRRGFVLGMGSAAALLSVGEVARAWEHLSPELKNLIKERWHAQDTMFQEITKGGFQTFYEHLGEGKKNVFLPKEAAKVGTCACCSDEGNRKYTSTSGEKMKLVRTPGSGILRVLDNDCKGPGGKLSPFSRTCIDAVAREALASGVTVFTGHAGCGAAKAVFIAWREDQGMSREEAANVKSEEVDAFASKWAMHVTMRMQEITRTEGRVSPQSIRTDFIRKLDRPKEIHVARCLYLTDTDDFDASYQGLPQGFVERTGGKDNLDNVLSHVEILRRIAFDDVHAFGIMFSEKPEEQFVICCVAESEARLKLLKDHAEKQIARIEPEEMRKKVRVDGFVRTE